MENGVSATTETQFEDYLALNRLDDHDLLNTPFLMGCLTIICTQLAFLSTCMRVHNYVISALKLPLAYD